MSEALRRLKERHGLRNLAETIEKIVLRASQTTCCYAIIDQTGRANCTYGNGHVGFCKLPCPYGKMSDSISESIDFPTASESRLLPAVTGLAIDGLQEILIDRVATQAFKIWHELPENLQTWDALIDLCIAFISRKTVHELCHALGGYNEKAARSAERMVPIKVGGITFEAQMEENRKVSENIENIRNQVSTQVHSLIKAQGNRFRQTTAKPASNTAAQLAPTLEVAGNEH